MSVIYDEGNRKNQLPAMSSVEEAALMKAGTKVVRGPDWKWYDQDRGGSSIGTVLAAVADDGWVRVQWASGETNSYR